MQSKLGKPAHEVNFLNDLLSSSAKESGMAGGRPGVAAPFAENEKFLIASDRFHVPARVC
jgi:hypothetical protein